MEIDPFKNWVGGIFPHASLINHDFNCPNVARTFTIKTVKVDSADEEGEAGEDNAEAVAETDADAEAKKKAKEEAAAKKKAEEEAAAKKKAEEEAVAKKKAEGGSQNSVRSRGGSPRMMAASTAINYVISLRPKPIDYHFIKPTSC